MKRQTFDNIINFNANIKEKLTRLPLPFRYHSFNCLMVTLALGSIIGLLITASIWFLTPLNLYIGGKIFLVGEILGILLANIVVGLIMLSDNYGLDSKEWRVAIFCRHIIFIENEDKYSFEKLKHKEKLSKWLYDNAQGLWAIGMVDKEKKTGKSGLFLFFSNYGDMLAFKLAFEDIKTTLR